MENVIKAENNREILIEKEWEDKTGKHYNALERQHQCLVFTAKKTNYSSSITIKFYKEYLICTCTSGAGFEFIMDYSEISTLCAEPYGLQGRDKSGKTHNLIFQTNDEVFEVLIKELSTFAGIETDKFRTKREHGRRTNTILAKYGSVIAVCAGIAITLIGLISDLSIVAAIGGTLVICVLGSAISTSLEASKKERQKEELEKKTRANLIYILSRRIYKLAPSKDRYVNQIYEDTLKSALRNEGNVYETKALQDECLSRNGETHDEVELLSKQSMTDYLDEVLCNPVRPELIAGVLLSNLDTHFELADDLVKVKIKACVDEFDKVYKFYIGTMKGNQKFAADFERNRFNNSAPATGLGFGIITSSPSQALLYEALNNHEREKQEKYKRINYENNVTKITGDKVKDTEERISELYTKFVNSLKTVIEQGI